MWFKTSSDLVILFGVMASDVDDYIKIGSPAVVDIYRFKTSFKILGGDVMVAESV